MLNCATASRLLLGLAAVVMAACSRPPVSPTPLVTIPPGVTPAPTLEPTPTEVVLTLRVWMPESLSPDGSGDGARVLAGLLSEFDARHPDARLRVSTKKDTGPGGLLDLLRAASPVAPDALPDAILLSDADLAIAAREGLIQPLDDLLSTDGEAVAFSFARTATQIDGKRMGLPLVVDFVHLAYRPERLDAPPADWTGIISETLSFPFAFSDGPHVSDAVLADYTQLGGTIIDAEGQPALSLDALTQLLILYRDARDAGVIAVSSVDWSGPDTAWDIFQASDAPVTVARASRFLAARAQGADLGYARAPSISQRPTPSIGRSWNLAVITHDPRHQALAVELLEHLIRDENLAEWTQAEHVLPATAAALALWRASDGYAAFALGELSRAVPPPATAALEAISPPFLDAIRDVLIGRSTPQAAAQAAIDAVARGEE